MHGAAWGYSAALPARLRRKLAASCSDRSDDVVVTDLETDFLWIVNPTNGADPLHACRLVGQLELGLADLLRALDALLGGMSGLSPLHAAPSEPARLDGERAVTHMWNGLRRAYAHRPPDGVSPHGALLHAVASAEHELRLEWVPAARERLKDQMDAVRALQRLCAAHNEARDVATQAHEDAALLRELVDLPPQQLVEELAQRGVDFEELTDMFTSEAVPGGSGAACLPQSLAVRTLGVLKWVQRNADAAQQACLTTLAVLGQLRQAPDDAEQWSGVKVQEAQDVSALARAELGRARPLPRLKHTAAFDGLAVVAMHNACGEPVALRPLRLARVMHELVRKKHLQPRTVRASLLFRLLTRVSIEAELGGAEGGAAGAPPPASPAPPAAVRAESALGRPVGPLPSELITGLGSLEACRAELLALEPSLYKEAALLRLIRSALEWQAEVAPGGRAVLPITILDQGMAALLSGAWTDATLHARKLWLAGAVRTRVLRHFRAASTAGEGNVHYNEAVGARSGKEIVMNAEGRTALHAYIDGTLQAMRVNGKRVARDWFHSAADKARAKRSSLSTNKSARAEGE